MSRSNVPHPEMTSVDERFERALRGETAGGDGDDLAAFVEDVRRAFPVRPMLAADARLEAIAQAARQAAAEGGDRSARRAGRSWVPTFRSAPAKALAAVVVVASSFGGLAVAGALPGGVQDAVANVASRIGVNLPGGDDEAGTAVGADRKGDATEMQAPEASSTEEPQPTETESPKADGQDQRSDEQGDDEGTGGSGNGSGETEASGDGSGDQSGGSGDGSGSTEGSGDASGSTERSSDGSADQSGGDGSTDASSEGSSGSTSDGGDSSSGD